jgi:quinol monooxygenase YgiN
MEFQPEHVDDFLTQFNVIKSSIRHFPGVQHLELHRDANQPNVFYTYSKWNDESDLEAYRQSDLFDGVWAQTKSWFAANARAYSMREELVVN